MERGVNVIADFHDLCKRSFFQSCLKIPRCILQHGCLRTPWSSKQIQKVSLGIKQGRLRISGESRRDREAPVQGTDHAHCNTKRFWFFQRPWGGLPFLASQERLQHWCPPCLASPQNTGWSMSFTKTHRKNTMAKKLLEKVRAEEAIKIKYVRVSMAIG